MELIKTELEKYSLFGDGTIEVNPDQLVDILLNIQDLNSVFVSELTPDVQQFNDLTDYNLTVKTESADINIDWVMPEKYINTNILPIIPEDDLYEERLRRLVQEVGLFESNDMYDVLRILIYVIDIFNEYNIVWGVGRGSSCASYLLYLLDLHLVDPVRYNIDLSEFFK